MTHATTEATAPTSFADRLQALEALPSSQRFTDSEMEAMYGLGVQLAERGDWHKAFDHFSFAATYKPTRPKYLRGVALTHRQLGRNDKALQAFLMLHRLEPENRQHEIDVADCLLRIGRPGEALTVLDGLVARCESGAVPADAILERARALRTILRERSTHAH